MTAWTPASWQQKPCAHYPDYPSVREVDQALNVLHTLPPLVTAAEVDMLKWQLIAAMEGSAFLFQGGDCAESFEECQTQLVKNKINLLNKISEMICVNQHCVVIQVGRIAGQYAKPRSSLLETKAGKTLPSYQGDMVNAIAFSEEARLPNPELMVKAYFHAVATMQIIRQQQASLYTSHEALLLSYEQAFTRFEQGKWYNLSTHFPWIGYRTSAVKGAHIEYARGIANPLAIKVGPATDPLNLQQLVLTLNPKKEKGRLVIMTRLGVKKVTSRLPALITAVAQTNTPVLWSCDPMHGNTCLTPTRIKTRYIEDIVTELTQTIEIHHKMKSRLGGIHLEMTSEPVTECMGGQCHFQEADLKKAYTSLVDPRLNAHQVKEVIQHLGVYDECSKTSQPTYCQFNSVSTW